MIPKKVRLGDLLVKDNLITEEQLQKALKIQKQEHFSKKLGEVLVDEGYVTPKDLLKALSRQLNIDFIDLFGERINFNELFKKYPYKLLKSTHAIPFKEDEDFVYVATSDPLNYEALELLEKSVFKPIKLFLASKDDIDVIIHRIEVLNKTKNIVQDVKRELTSPGARGEESAVMKLINLIINDSVSRRASDIHIEPNDKEVIIRERIDGVLHESFVFDLDIYHALASRVKLLGGMDIAEKLIPQDGRFTLKVNNKTYDFRLSSEPTIYGESIVIRVLDVEKALIKLEKLGFEEENLEVFEDLIHSPYGILLITGPTGSGKTTTLNAAINEIKDITNKIMTAEDPVEYRLPLVQHVQINEKKGLTYAKIISAFMRQDPDIILVGEIRDPETLQAASQAALTGHMVFSTLHTTNAPGSIPRLIQMGLEPYLLSDILVGVVAQRLVRKICPYCKEEVKPPMKLIEKVKKYLPENPKFYAGKGCKKCNFTGYFDRIMISEVLPVNEKISKIFTETTNRIEIEEYAIKNSSYKPMIVDGVKKALKGITTLEEVLRVVKEV